MRFSHLYDHVLSELEFGRTEIAVNLLVGILDTAAMQSEVAAQARVDLLDHPLLGMLREDPLFGLAEQPADFDMSAAISSTGRRLCAATRETALGRALRQRMEHASAKLLRAWRAGKTILLIADPHHGLLSALQGFDTANVTVCTIDDIGAVGGEYQLILAPSVADAHDARALAAVARTVNRLLAADGEIILSALIAGHPGSGWRSICLGRNPHCHDDQQLMSMVPPGLGAQIYHDEGDCIAWIAMRPAPAGHAPANQTA